MTIKSKVKRLIVLNYVDASGNRHSLNLSGGATETNEHLKDEDVAYYKNKKAIEVLEDKTSDTSKESDKTKVLEPVVLPEEKTIASLKKALLVEDMKRYCKDNKIKGITGKDETELATMILESLGIEIVEDETVNTEESTTTETTENTDTAGNE